MDFPLNFDAACQHAKVVFRCFLLSVDGCSSLAKCTLTYAAYCGVTGDERVLWREVRSVSGFTPPMSAKRTYTAAFITSSC